MSINALISISHPELCICTKITQIIKNLNSNIATIFSKNALFCYLIFSQTELPLYYRIIVIEHRTRNNHFGDLAAFHVFQLIFNKGTTRAMCDVLRQWMCDKKCGKSRGEELEKMNERCNFQLYDFPSIYFFVMWQKKYIFHLYCIRVSVFLIYVESSSSYKLSGMSNAEFYPPEKKGKEKKKFESKHKLNENQPYPRYWMSVCIFISNIQTALPFSVHFLIHK